MDVVSSTSVTLWADFETSQGLTIPEPGSVYYSLYDTRGVALVLRGDLTPEAEATGVSIEINSIHNVLAPERDFERRLVTLTWNAAGRTYSRRITYRITALPLHSVTADDVRNYLALGSDELPDDAVDIFSAQLAVEEAVGKDAMAAALSSGTRLELRAERAILLAAAAQLFPSLRYRIAQSKTDGTAKFERLKDPAAFAELVQATGEELSSALGTLTGTGLAPADTVPILIQLSTVATDAITGSAPVGAGA